MSKFWLIQRASFNKISADRDFLCGDRWNRVVDFDYMGAAEFEWGAIPRAYIRILGRFDEYSLHITDLKTNGRVPFCLFCRNEQYEKILEEIKSYIKDPYHMKEASNLEAHFTEIPKEGVSRNFYKYKLKTNFWWCIDKNSETGDWIAFTGATDRQNAFTAAITKEYSNWWIKKPEEEREAEFKKAYNGF